MLRSHDADHPYTEQKTEAEVDDVLNKTIALFRFLVEKDTFERYYNSHLAKRLISSRSVSDDAERNMLAKFKIEAGAAFTKSAEGMMKDIKTSEDTMVEYKRQQERAAIVRRPRTPILMSQRADVFSFFLFFFFSFSSPFHRRRRSK